MAARQGCKLSLPALFVAALALGSLAAQASLAAERTNRRFSSLTTYIPGLASACTIPQFPGFTLTHHPPKRTGNTLNSRAFYYQQGRPLRNAFWLKLEKDKDGSNTLVFNWTYLGNLPHWVKNGTVDLDATKGTPTSMAIQLALSRELLSTDPGKLAYVKVAQVQNVRTLAEIAEQTASGKTLESAMVDTHTHKAITSVMRQLGYDLELVSVIPPKHAHRVTIGRLMTDRYDPYWTDELREEFFRQHPTVTPKSKLLTNWGLLYRVKHLPEAALRN